MHSVREFILPIEGAVFVWWGGDTKEQNHHHDNAAQKFAFDLVGVPNGADRVRWRGNGARNDDYFIFGRRILAPFDGVVVEAIDGIRDNTPAKLNNYMMLGNMIVLQHTDSVFSVLAHLKLGSIVLRSGDAVRQGQIIGLCGNSGRSSEPHLHFHVQSTDDINEADGLKCYFKRLRVNDQMREDYSATRFEVIANVEA